MPTVINHCCTIYYIIGTDNVLKRRIFVIIVLLYGLLQFIATWLRTNDFSNNNTTLQTPQFFFNGSRRDGILSAVYNPSTTIQAFSLIKCKLCGRKSFHVYIIYGCHSNK